MSTTQTIGTTIRDTPAGMIATKGKRELHLLGTSVDQTKRARHLLATRSFNQLFQAGRSYGSTGRNVRAIRL